MIFYWMIIVLISSLTNFGCNTANKECIYSLKRELDKNYREGTNIDENYLVPIFFSFCKFLIQVMTVAYFIKNSIGGYITYIYAAFMLINYLKGTIASKIWGKEWYLNNRIEKWTNNERPYIFTNSIDVIYILYILYIIK